MSGLPTQVLVRLGHTSPERHDFVGVEIAATQTFRKVGATTVSSLELVKFLDRLEQHSLKHKILSTVETFYGFVHTHSPAVKNASYFIAFSSEAQHLKRFEDAYLRGDHASQGSLLGYPKCCSRAFTQWADHGFYDPVVPYLSQGQDNAFITPALRYGGWRVVPFLPCSPRCKNALKIARRYLEHVEPWWIGKSYFIEIDRGKIVVDVDPIRIVCGTVRFRDKIVFEGTYGS